MMAVLVLSGITAVAFSIAAIVFVEIRASGDLLRTEPALYAVQGVTEEAFYSTTRNLSNFTFSTTINGVGLTTEPRTHDPSPQTYVVYRNAETKFSLVDPATPFRNTYTMVKIDYISPPPGTEVAVQVYQYQEGGQSSTVATQSLTAQSPSYTINFSIFPGNATSEYEIILTTTNLSNATVLVTSEKTGTPSSGLPLVGRQAYDVTASYLGLTRKYTVSTPTTSAAGCGSDCSID